MCQKLVRFESRRAHNPPPHGHVRGSRATKRTGRFRPKAAVALSLLLHATVVHVPFLQQAFSTVGLSAADWLVCAAVASSVLWLRELSKAAARMAAARPGPAHSWSNKRRKVP